GITGMNRRMTRRTLLRRTVAAAGAIAGEAVFPAPTLLASTSPNSKLATAVIGSGGRGEASLMAAAEETLVAIADVDDARRQRRKVSPREHHPLRGSGRLQDACPKIGAHNLPSITEPVFLA